MLDYYGSIRVKNKNDIIKSIVKIYNNKYNDNYIINIIEYLYSKRLLEKEYSISGWNMFNSSIC